MWQPLPLILPCDASTRPSSKPCGSGGTGNQRRPGERPDRLCGCWGRRKADLCFLCQALAHSEQSFYADLPSPCLFSLARLRAMSRGGENVRVPAALAPGRGHKSRGPTRASGPLSGNSCHARASRGGPCCVLARSECENKRRQYEKDRNGFPQFLRVAPTACVAVRPPWAAQRPCRHVRRLSA